jgi:hypothetical protein
MEVQQTRATGADAVGLCGKRIERMLSHKS